MVRFCQLLIAATFLILQQCVGALEWNVRKIGNAAAAGRTNAGIDLASVASTKAFQVDQLLNTRPGEAIQLPLADGTIRTFRIHPSNILSPKLAKRYPTIRSFEGESVNNVQSPHEKLALKNEKISVVLSVSKTVPGGTALHVQYFSNKRGYMFLEPVADKNANSDDMNFRVASRSATLHGEQPPNTWTCDTEDGIERKLLDESLISSHVQALEENRRKLQDAGCNVEALGNFQCDPANNRAECNFDAGDCCGGFKERFAECIPNDDPTSCLCKDPNYLVVTPRTLRLAVAANVEFSELYNYNPDAVMAQIVHTFTRVAGIFRREVGVGFEIVYTQIETDPATRTIGNSGTVAVASQLPEIFDAAIGNDGYDIGHCLTTTPGGVAGGIGVSCNPATKAMGVTGRGDVTGNVHFVDIVVHEMGHQMGSHHMFSGCGGNPGTPGFRVEPGSGTTFMSYASICGSDNVQDRMSPYFHTLSLESMRRYQSNPVGGANCGSYPDNSKVDRPTVEAQLSLLNPRIRECSIPPLTPFRLSAVGAPITDGFYYSWEQVDNTAGNSPNNLDDTPPTDGALFRSIPPKQNDPSRIFPSMASILGRTSVNYHERLPPTSRELEFVLGVRKQYIGHETIDTTSFYLTDYSAFYVGDAIKVKVEGDPLQVDTVSSELDQEDDQFVFTIKWSGGKLASKVRILAAVDDDQQIEPNFSILVGSNIKNDGEFQITYARSEVCQISPGSQARLLVSVESDEYLEGCSYFSVSRDPIVLDCSDFTEPPTLPPTNPDTVRIDFEYGPEDGVFTENGKNASELYENNHYYTYTISGQAGQFVQLEFVELSVEQDWDYVHVYDGDSEESPLIWTFTGDGSGIVVTGSSNKLFMTLTTDEVINGAGFVVKHASVDESTTPTSAPTSGGDGSGFFYVEVHEGEHRHDINVVKQSTFLITASVNGKTELQFDQPTYQFNGELYLTSAGILETKEFEFGDPVNSDGFVTTLGYIYIIVKESNSFPLTVSFTLNHTAIEVEDFGPVTVHEPTSYDGIRAIGGSTKGLGEGYAARYQRGSLDIASPHLFTAHFSGDNVCVLSKGNVSDPAYSYVGNIIGIATNQFNPDSQHIHAHVEEFISSFPKDLGISNVEEIPIVNQDPYPDYAKFELSETSAISVTCGQHQEHIGLPFFSMSYMLNPILVGEPLSGTGEVTASSLQGFGWRIGDYLDTVHAVGIKTLDGTPITLKFQQPSPETATYIYSKLGFENLLHGSAPLYVFVEGQYPTEEILIAGYDEIVVFVYDEEPDDSFRFEYSVANFTGNITEPIGDEQVGDLVNVVNVETSEPFLFESGNKPYNTRDNALLERWEFHAPAGYTLRLTFTLLDVEESADFVHVYNGTSVENRISSFTGSRIPPSIVSNDKFLMVRVVRDSSDDREYLGVQGFVEVVRDAQDDQWYWYVIAGFGVATVGTAALLVRKKLITTERLQPSDLDEEAMTASAIEYMESSKRDSSDLIAANPLFDANDI